MPKKAINYENTIIYKLCCNDPTITDIYVGHTTNFIKRKSQHKNSTNNLTDPSYNSYKYQFIRNNGGFNNWSMIQIIKIVCENVYDACRIERQYIEQLNATLNINRPITTLNEKIEQMKECCKHYYEKNKDKICEQQKYYYQVNKDYITEHKREKMICFHCNNKYNRSNFSTHNKTQKHKKALSSDDSNDDDSS